MLPTAVGVTWAGTKVLTDAPRHRAARPTVRVRFLSPAAAAAQHGRREHLVEISGEQATQPGTWGIRVGDSFVQVGPAISRYRDDEQVLWAVRPFREIDGTAPTWEATGDRRREDRDRRARDAAAESPTTADVDDAQLALTGPRDRRRLRRDRRRHAAQPPWPHDAVMTHYAWPDDPQVLARHHDARWEIEAIPTSGGHLPAWRFTPKGPRDTWVIGVHGRGAQRTELYRLIGLCLEARLPSLVVSYRTDQWTAQPARLTTLGTTEWRDVEAAMQLAMSRGARRVILAGFSMGGAIVAMTVRRSEFAGAVAGVILDSPALDWGPTLRHVATVRHVPRGIVPVVMLLARARARVDWAGLNQVASAGEFVHPILLVHGTGDEVTPIWLSDALAEARPDLVTYLRVEGAGHVKAWNVERARYEQAVLGFLDVVAGRPGHWRDRLPPNAGAAPIGDRRMLPVPRPAVSSGALRLWLPPPG